MLSGSQHQTLRALAGRWMELASLPVMAERQRLWTAQKDLHAERPMILFETWTLEHYVEETELVCTDPELREIERIMRRYIRQVEEIQDDLVLEPHWKVYWEIEADNYGVDLQITHTDDAHGGDVAYAFNHPIRTPEEISRLKPRTWKSGPRADHPPRGTARLPLWRSAAGGAGRHRRAACRHDR